MRHPVSTPFGIVDATGAGLDGWVVDSVVGPDAPEHASPSTSQYAPVRMIATALARGGVGAGSPGAGMA